jgi:hypothetical protein
MRFNIYKSKCYKCQEVVLPYDGILEKHDDKFYVQHVDCNHKITKYINRITNKSVLKCFIKNEVLTQDQYNKKMLPVNSFKKRHICSNMIFPDEKIGFNYMNLIVLYKNDDSICSVCNHKIKHLIIDIEGNIYGRKCFIDKYKSSVNMYLDSYYK